MCVFPASARFGIFSLFFFFVVRFFFYLFIFAVRQSNKLDAKPIYGPSIIIKTRQKKKRRTDRRAKKKMFAKRGIIILYSIVDVVAVVAVDAVVVVGGSGNVANLPLHFHRASSVRNQIKREENAIHLRFWVCVSSRLRTLRGCRVGGGGGRYRLVRSVDRLGRLRLRPRRLN